MLDERFSTFTPPARTASGSSGRARFTRLLTWTSAVSGSVSIVKYTVSVISPVAELVDCM